jgi:hypothetical protein
MCPKAALALTLANSVVVALGPYTLGSIVYAAPARFARVATAVVDVALDTHDDTPTGRIWGFV